MKLLPKFSIRQMLIAMIAIAILSACLAGAFRGNVIAFGLIVGCAALIVPVIGLTMGYWIAYAIAQRGRSRLPSDTPNKKLWWIALFVSSYALSISANAQVTIPPGKFGYTVSVDDEYPYAGVGFRPVRVTLATNPTRVVAKDFEFTVVVKMNSYDFRSSKIFSAPMLLEAGQSAATVELYLPTHQEVGFRNQELIVERGIGNQRFDHQRDICFAELGSSGASFNQYVQPSTLLISSLISTGNGTQWDCYDGKVLPERKVTISSNGALPALEYLEDLPAYAPQLNTGSGKSAFTAITSSEQIHACHPHESPRNWIGLSSVEQVLISYKDFKLLSDGDYQRRDALERWLAAGGSLIVFDLGERIDDADPILTLLVGQQRSENLPPQKMIWREPSKKLSDILKLISTSGEMDHYNAGDDAWIRVEDLGLGESEWWKPSPSVGEQNTKPKFLIGQYLSGRIVVVGSNMQDWQANQWVQLHNAIVLHGTSLVNHIGTADLGQYGSSFNVPGVGEPPLVAFQILIGMFVFAAGPLMILVLTRTRQLQLLFLLVPILSLSVCLGLIAYAIFVDGFQSWGRMQSVTWIDQQTNAAVTQANCAYYCGTQPKPYQYSLDILPTVMRDDSSPSEQIRQTSNGMEISGGNIRPRTPHQVVTVRSYQTDQRLIWRTSKATNENSNLEIDVVTDPKSEPPKGEIGSVVSRFESTILFAAAKTDAGWVSVDQLASGESKAVEVTDEIEINRRLKELALELSPSYEIRSTYSYSFRANDETTLGDHHAITESLRNHSGSKYLDSPHTYIAILESFPEVAKQTEAVNYKKQLHVIIGKW